MALHTNNDWLWTQIEGYERLLSFYRSKLNETIDEVLKQNILQNILQKTWWADQLEARDLEYEEKLSKNDDLLGLINDQMEAMEGVKDMQIRKLASAVQMYEGKVS